MMIDYDDRPGIVRCGEHSDYGTITILFQVRTETCSKNKGSGGFVKLKLKPTHTQDSLGGLEAKSVTGDWLSADPITGAILINVGDLLENLTSGR